MRKCLITKLNSFVYNDDLEKFGEFRFTMQGGSCKIGRLPGTSPIYLSTVNNSTYDNELIVEGINANSSREYDTQGLLTTFSISYKYSLSVINTNTNLINFDINEWLKLNSLTFICCLGNSASVTGDLKQFCNEYAKLYPMHNTITMMVAGTGIYNVPRGISNFWNVYSQLIFDSSYKDGWYTFDGDSHYYNSDGEEIYP